MVDMPQTQTKPNHIYLIYIYKEDLVLNNLWRLIFYKTKTNKSNTSLMGVCASLFKNEFFWSSKKKKERKKERKKSRNQG